MHGYKDKRIIDVPLELAILDQIDRINLMVDAIDRPEIADWTWPEQALPTTSEVASGARLQSGEG